MTGNKIKVKERHGQTEFWHTLKVRFLDKVLFGVGTVLLLLGVGFLVVVPISNPDITGGPYILGGLLGSAIGGVTIIVSRAMNYEKRELDALR